MRNSAQCRIRWWSLNPDRWNPNFVTRGINGDRSCLCRKHSNGSTTSGRTNLHPAPQRSPNAQCTADAVSNSLRRKITREFTPLIGPLLRNRLLCGLLLAAWLVQVGLVYQGFGGWSCPVGSISSLPCPGCGLSRAVVCLLQGHFHTAMAIHPMAPVILAVPIPLLVGVARSKPSKYRIVRSLESMERRVPVVGIFLTAMLLRWAFVLAAVPKAGLSG